MKNWQHSFTHPLKNSTHTSFGDTHNHLWDSTQPRANLLGNRTSASVNEKNPCWGHWGRLLILTSAPRDHWLRPPGRAGPELYTSSVHRVTGIYRYSTGTHPALPACCQTPAGKWSHKTLPLSDVQKQKAFNFVFNQFTYWLVLSADIPEILSATEAKKCQIAVFLEVSQIQGRNSWEIISFDNSWFLFPGIPPSAWRISDSRNSLTLHSIQLW